MITMTSRFYCLYAIYPDMDQTASAVKDNKTVPPDKPAMRLPLVVHEIV